jgi:hypothetical protein
VSTEHDRRNNDGVVITCCHFLIVEVTEVEGSQQRATVCHKAGTVYELIWKEEVGTDRKSWKVGWSQGEVESRLFFDMSMSKKTHFHQKHAHFNQKHIRNMPISNVPKFKLACLILQNEAKCQNYGSCKHDLEVHVCSHCLKRF